MSASAKATRTLPAHVALERWYQRLLRAYPVGYRRAHGQEILATLMDSAEPGRRVLARADVVDLARGALRQWFRLPVGWSAVVTAVLSAVLLGTVGAAAGSWAAWQTAADLPSETAALRTAETAAGTPLTAPYVQRVDGVGVVWRALDVSSPREQWLPNWTVTAAQARLRADGWTLGTVGKPYPSRLNNQPQPNDVHQVFTATRDGLTLAVYAHTVDTPGITGTTVSTSIYPTAPSWEPGAILLGWLVGAVTGWLLTGWAGYRLRRRARPRRLAALALGLAALGLIADPAFDLYRTLGETALADPPIFRPPPAYQLIVADPTATQVAAALAIGLTILALAATGRRSAERPAAEAA